MHWSGPIINQRLGIFMMQKFSRKKYARSKRILIFNGGWAVQGILDYLFNWSTCIVVFVWHQHYTYDKKTYHSNILINPITYHISVKGEIGSPKEKNEIMVTFCSPNDLKFQKIKNMFFRVIFGYLEDAVRKCLSWNPWLTAKRLRECWRFNSFR